MISCEEVSRIVASDELVKSASQHRFAIRFHLLICRYCRRYIEQLSAIDTAVRRRWGAASDDPAALERLRRRTRLDSGSNPVEANRESDD
jgi:hypothetical protein